MARVGPFGARGPVSAAERASRAAVRTWATEYPYEYSVPEERALNRRALRVSPGGQPLPSRAAASQAVAIVRESDELRPLGLDVYWQYRLGTHWQYRL